MLLNQFQRDWTGIADRAVFSGTITGVELCAESTWEAEIGELDENELLQLRDLAWRPLGAEGSPR